MFQDKGKNRLTWCIPVIWQTRCFEMRV